MEGNNIGIYKAYIRDANSLKNLALSSLFSKGNKFNLGSVSSFMPILTTVEELLIIYIYLSASYTYTQSAILLY